MLGEGAEPPAPDLRASLLQRDGARREGGHFQAPATHVQPACARPTLLCPAPSLLALPNRDTGTGDGCAAGTPPPLCVDVVAGPGSAPNTPRDAPPSPWSPLLAPPSRAPRDLSGFRGAASSPAPPGTSRGLGGEVKTGAAVGFSVLEQPAQSPAHPTATYRHRCCSGSSSQPSARLRQRCVRLGRAAGWAALSHWGNPVGCSRLWRKQEAGQGHAAGRAPGCMSTGKGRALPRKGV